MTPEEQLQYPGYRRQIQLSLSRRFQILWLRNPKLKLAELLTQAWPENSQELSDTAFIKELEKFYDMEREDLTEPTCGYCRLNRGRLYFSAECPEHGLAQETGAS
jgi:hypothetical protein